MIIAVIIFILVAFVYLIIYGSSQNKSKEERKREDEEQMEYLRKYEEQKILKRAEKIKNKFCKKNGEMKKIKER